MKSFKSNFNQSDEDAVRSKRVFLTKTTNLMSVEKSNLGAR